TELGQMVGGRCARDAAANHYDARARRDLHCSFRRLQLERRDTRDDGRGTRHPPPAEAFLQHERADQRGEQYRYFAQRRDEGEWRPLANQAIAMMPDAMSTIPSTVFALGASPRKNTPSSVTINGATPRISG